jgi:probable phosphoglycerate mutase
LACRFAASLNQEHQVQNRRMSELDDESAVSSRLALVRHGEGHANVDMIIGGLKACAGLTDIGRRQAQALSARWRQQGFRPDVLVSSPVRRARETAGALATSMPFLVVTEDCALCDIHLGDADGLSWTEYDERYGRFNLVAEPSRPFAPGAECWSEVTQRVRGCLEELAVRNAGKTVVAVTHAGFILASLLDLLAVPSSAKRAQLDPRFTSITTWHWTAGRWSLIGYNDIAHLNWLSAGDGSR